MARGKLNLYTLNSEYKPARLNPKERKSLRYAKLISEASKIVMEQHNTHVKKKTFLSYVLNYTA